MDEDIANLFKHRLAAGHVTNEYFAMKRRKAVEHRYNEHWKKAEDFGIHTLTKDKHRRCLYYSGQWNPVMWNDYPRMPAWTVPLPKITGPEVCGRYNFDPKRSCYFSHTEVMDKICYPCWFKNRPIEVSHECNPYVTEDSIPFKATSGLECPVTEKESWKGACFPCKTHC